MTYIHDRSDCSVVGLCVACRTRWLAANLTESRDIAARHEVAHHPTETRARVAVRVARHRDRLEL